MLPLLRTFPRNALLVQERLHLVEQLLADERFMPSAENLLVRLAFVEDAPPGIERIAQEPLQRRSAQRTFRSALGRTRRQAEPRQLFGELRDGVLARAVELKRQRHEVMPLRIGGDDRDAAAIRQMLHVVDVAERNGAADTAVHGLLPKTALDALAGQHGLVLVVRDDHALVEEAGRGVLAGNRLADRDEPKAGLVDLGAGLPVVDRVARPAVERPHDDVVNAGARVLVEPLQVVQHVEEAGALVKVDVGAPAGVGVFLGDVCAELRRLVSGGFASAVRCADT